MNDTHPPRIIVIWDLPMAVACGEAFGITVGTKCPAGCLPLGWQIEVLDEQGTPVARVPVSGEPASGTESLYATELALEAPESVGRHCWQVRLTETEEAGRDEESGHDSVTAAITLRTEPQPDYRLTVIAIDGESRSPVQGARVVVHPYRSLTDAEGVAELSLPRGRYRLFVSGKDFFPFRADGELITDTTIRAELSHDRAPTDSETWS